MASRSPLAAGGRLPDGYQTDIGSVRAFGEAILAPTVALCTPVTEALAKARALTCTARGTSPGTAGANCSAILGSSYRIDARAAGAASAERSCSARPADAAEAYGTLNMGAGFAFFVRPDQAPDDANRAAAVALMPGLRAGWKPVPNGPSSSKALSGSPTAPTGLKFTMSSGANPRKKHIAVSDFGAGSSNMAALLRNCGGDGCGGRQQGGRRWHDVALMRAWRPSLSATRISQGDREAFDAALVERLNELQADVVVLAGSCAFSRQCSSMPLLVV